MRDRTILPTNLLDWPRCSGLLPEQRLILIWLWATYHMTAAGWGFIPLEPSAATLGFKPEALAGGLSTLDSAGLIVWDSSTGEVAIVDWYRFHKFRKGGPARAAAASIKKIQSERVKNVILEKSMGYLPTATATPTVTVLCMHQGQSAPRKQPASPGAGACKKKTSERGVVCWTDDDRHQVADLIGTYGAERVTAAAKKMAEQGMEPLPSRVSSLLKGQSDGKPDRNHIKNADDGTILDAAITSSLLYYGVTDEGEHEIEGERVTECS